MSQRDAGYLGGLYTGEGSCECSKDTPARRAIFKMKIRMKDRGALERAQRILGTKVAGPDEEGLYRIEKGGREAYRILSRIPRSAERARKDEICLNRCRALWAQGWKDTID